MFSEKMKHYTYEWNDDSVLEKIKICIYQTKIDLLVIIGKGMLYLTWESGFYMCQA